MQVLTGTVVRRGGPVGVAHVSLCEQNRRHPPRNRHAMPAANTRLHKALQANAKTKATGPAAHRRASLGTHDIRQGEEVLVAQGARWRRAGAPQGHVASDAHR